MRAAPRKHAPRSMAFSILPHMAGRLNSGCLLWQVPAILVGRLIGKGGSGIRELRDVSRAQIRILSECEPVWNKYTCMIGMDMHACDPPSCIPDPRLVVYTPLLCATQGTDQRKITCSGEPQAVQMAFSMIAQRLAQGP